MKVLIIDDNTDDRKLLRLNLERHGCETVFEACNGQEGLEMVKTHRPDLIISDAMMPRMDGFELLRAIKTDADLSAIPFIFHSSVYTGMDDEKLVTDLGAEAFIAKPKQPEEFWGEIAAIMEKLATVGEKPPPSEPIKGEKEYLREYSGVVAAKLEQKVHELEHALALMKVAEEKVSRAKKEWEKTFDSVLDPIMILDSEYRIKRANMAMAELIGVTPSDLVGTICHEKVHCTQEPVPYCPHFMLLRDGKAHTEEIYEKNFDRYFSVTVYPVFDDNEKLAGSVHTMRDITERRNLEEQLRHSQKMEAMGTLAGGVAHDFNNILTAIIGFSSLLQVKMSKNDPLQINVTQVLAAAERAASLTRSLLAFSRKESIDTKPVELNAIVTGMEKMLQRLIREDYTLQISAASCDLTVMADAGQIEQVLLNLVTNARDAMPEGGCITIDTERAELDSEFRQSHGLGEEELYALIVFSDNGDGMDEGIRKRIFEPFFTTKEVGKGTGLGLSICYGIIKQHKGHIDCVSEPGRGTTFRIYLPLVPSAVGKKEEMSASLRRGGGEIILLAEDEPDVRSLTTILLEEYGYKVVAAGDGEAAVSMFMEQAEMISLCLFDVIMPKKTGPDAYEEIRKINPGMRVLFMSGYADSFIRKNGLAGEETDFVSKPFRPETLLQKVREVLDGTR